MTSFEIEELEFRQSTKAVVMRIMYSVPGILSGIPVRCRSRSRIYSAMGIPAMMNDKISVGEVKDLGRGKFSVCLTVEEPESVVSRTETVSAQDRDAAVQIAKDSFRRWLKKVTAYVVKNMPEAMRN